MIGCQPAKVDRPSVELTGITTILRRKMALLTIINAGIKSGEHVLKPYAMESVMLAEGQEYDGIQIRTIDERTGVVQIVNEGESQSLDFQR